MRSSHCGPIHKGTGHVVYFVRWQVLFTIDYSWKERHPACNLHLLLLICQNQMSQFYLLHVHLLFCFH